ncbi:MAG: pseudouridine synthase [Patescibacteria group bacterium]
MLKDKPSFPVRLNKYLADHYPVTRRSADTLITKGKVKINGKVAVLGQMVQAGDTVKVESKASRPAYRYFAYHKPIGVATHASAPSEKAILNVLRLPIKAFPIGRLDKDSRGLIILSDDGRLAGALLAPEFKHEKEYVVTTDRTINDANLKQLAVGVKIENYHTKKAKTKKIRDKEFSIILTEGKKHQIRRMCAALSLQVHDLIRTRIENIELGKLPAGEVREITGSELVEFLTRLGLQKKTTG